MQAMVLERPGAPLRFVEQSDPRPASGEVRVQVTACGVCRTDLHVVDGELPNPKLPIVPGHEIVGRIEMIGDGVNALEVGQRVGVPWLGRFTADTVVMGRKICVIGRCSPAIRATADMPAT